MLKNLFANNGEYSPKVINNMPETNSQQLEKTEYGRGILAIMDQYGSDVIDILPPEEIIRQYLLALGITHDASDIITAVLTIFDIVRPGQVQPGQLAAMKGALSGAVAAHQEAEAEWQCFVQ